MPAVVQISEPLIREYITRAVNDVFKTMVGHSPALIALAQMKNGRPDLGPETNRPQVVGTVGFMGDVSGVVHLHLDLAFARSCACSMLGMSEAELEAAGDEVLNDAIGELSNMTVGLFKNGLCDVGYPSKLTMPSISRGTDFSIEPINSATRYVYCFEYDNRRLVADILLKNGES